MSKNIPGSGFPEWKTWKTVKVVPGETADATRQELKDAGFRVRSWCDNYSNPYKYRSESFEVPLVLVKPEALGLVPGAASEEVVKAAKPHHLYPCPTQVGPKLLLQHNELSLFRNLVIPLYGSYEKLFLLYRHRDDAYIQAIAPEELKWTVNKQALWVFARYRY